VYKKRGLFNWKRGGKRSIWQLKLGAEKGPSIGIKKTWKEERSCKELFYPRDHKQETTTKRKKVGQEVSKL